MHYFYNNNISGFFLYIWVNVPKVKVNNKEARAKHWVRLQSLYISEPEESSISSEYSQYRGQVRSHLFRKAKRKALRMSIVIVAAFVICWSPYYFVFMYFTFLDLREMPRKTMLPLAFIGLSNSLINPMIYGAFQLCKVHSPRSVATIFQKPTCMIVTCISWLCMIMHVILYAYSFTTLNWQCSYLVLSMFSLSWFSRTVQMNKNSGSSIFTLE